MALSNKAYNLLADSLAPKVAEFIYSSEEFTELMHSLVPHAVSEELGELDPDVLFELSLSVMDRITLKAE